jgi:hypothetical protein
VIEYRARGRSEVVGDGGPLPLEVNGDWGAASAEGRAALPVAELWCSRLGCTIAGEAAYIFQGRCRR